MLRKYDTSQFVAWIALAIAIAALVLAFEGQGPSGDEAALQMQEVPEVSSESVRQFVANQAQAIEVEAEAMSEEEMAQAVATLRARLSARAEFASAEVRAQVEEWDNALAQVETEARVDTAVALGDLEQLVGELQVEVGRE